MTNEELSISDATLIERLRELGDHASFEPHMHHTAADRIEQLVATNEALTAENERLGQQCEGLMQAGMNNGQALIIAENKLSKTEGLLAKAVEGLTVIDALDPEGLVNGCSQSALTGLVLRMGEIARATLAAVSETHKIKSHSDEFATQKGENHE